MTELEFEVVPALPPKAPRLGQWGKLFEAIRAGETVRVPTDSVSASSIFYSQARYYNTPVSIHAQDGYYYISAKS